jgi:hypothetical protein
MPTIEADGWALLSAEDRAAVAPREFIIPPRFQRAGLQAGDAAKLIFDIEMRIDGHVIDRGSERMWVIVKSREADGYTGVLDNDPGLAENLSLHEGELIVFGPEHICEISTPPRSYVVDKYGPSFFEKRPK